jgi:hypothetical protein
VTHDLVHHSSGLDHAAGLLLSDIGRRVVEVPGNACRRFQFRSAWRASGTFRYPHDIAGIARCSPASAGLSHRLGRKWCHDHHTTTQILDPY